MSVISLLVIEPTKLPTFEAVKKEAAKAGDPIEFIEPVDLSKHTGFLPVRAYSRDTGFEYYFDAVPNGTLPPDVMSFGSHHIVTQTGSSFEEGRAALMFLKIASRLSGGAYVYPDGAIVVPPEQVMTYLDEQIDQFKALIK
jgi:hypothetical protein